MREEQRRAVRNADTPTAEMYGECQELLQMFGLPYIIAPMEAEAQCAWLNAAGLVDGVVTDDNDAFLFGAKEVSRVLGILVACYDHAPRQRHSCWLCCACYVHAFAS